MTMTPRARLSTLVAVRVIVSTLLLGSATVIELNRPGTFAVDAFFASIGLTYALSIGALATLRMVERWPWLIDAQFVIDAVLVSAFIFVTGGIVSYFSSLYVLPIIAASMIQFRRGALKVAAFSAVLYLAIIGLQYGPLAAWVPDAWRVAGELPGGRFAVFTAAINLFGFVAVALLSGSLAENLRSAGARLEHASLEMADLRAFNEHVIDSLLSGLATADPFPKGTDLNRHSASGAPPHLQPRCVEHHGLAGRTGRRPACGRGAAAAGRRPSRARSAAVDARPAGGDPVPDARRPAARRRDDGECDRVLERPQRLAIHLPGRHRHPAPRAERAATAATGGGGRDGGRHRPRDPQPTGVDVGVAPGAA